MAERALSFGAAAVAYERYRPGYPDELVDAVLTYASDRVATALEIGAGTGKATRAFAARDIAVTATEPDAAMLEQLRRHVPETVTTLRAAFEDLGPDTTYDLVFAAASMHWTQQAGRWDRVAALLRPGGVFACFGGPIRLADEQTERAVRAARSALLADDGVASPDGTPTDSALQWPGTELTASAAFTDVRQSSIERRVVMSAQDYVGQLSTVSAYLQLVPPVRDAVFARILRVLPDRVTVTSDLTLHLARRR